MSAARLRDGVVARRNIKRALILWYEESRGEG